MADSDLVLIGVGAIALIYLAPKLKLLLNPTTPSQTAGYFDAMGYETSTPPSAAGAPVYSYVTMPQGNTNTTYRFGTGDWDRMNWAQKFLLSIKIVPTKWILG